MKKTKLFRGVVEKLEKKAEKNKSKFEKGEFIALVLFVGIPLPGTGAWTGALVASVLGMNKKKARKGYLNIFNVFFIRKKTS